MKAVSIVEEGGTGMDVGFTVAEALTVPALKQATVVAGRAGLANVVRWVHILDIPDIVPWVSAGDLVLTNCYQFSTRPDIAKGLITELAGKQVAGMVLGVGLYLSSIPRRMLADANRRAFPLIQIASETRFEDLTHQLIGKLLYNPEQILQLADQATAEVAIVASTSELQGLCDGLALILGKNVIVSIEPGTRVQSSGIAALSASELISYAASLLGNDRSDPRIGRLGGRYLLLHPLVAGDRIIGQILIVSDTGFTPLDLLNAAHLAGLISLKLIVQTERVRRVSTARSEFLERLLLGAATGDLSDLQARSSVLGLRDGDPFVVSATSGTSAGTSLDGLRDIVTHAAGTLAGRITDVFALERDGTLIQLIPLRGVGGGVTGLMDALRNHVRGSNGPFTIGISDTGHHLSDACSRFGQASRAASLGARLYGLGAVCQFSELRTFDLLDQLADTDPNVEFTLAQGLEQLIVADTEHGLKLLDTVKAYLRCGGNLERTASRLFLHRNSVRYRIERARTCLGTDLSDPGRWFQLQMALAIHDLRKRSTTDRRPSTAPIPYSTRHA